MRKSMMLIAAAALPLGLAACGGEAEAPVEAAPEAPDGISVSDGRMNLPAVAGNPAALYFTITNDGETDQMLRAANIPGAESAVFHMTVEWDGGFDMQETLQVAVPAGESVVFEPGGMHVMAFDVDPALEPGGEVEVTLSFVRGDKVSFPVRLLAPGDDGSGG